MSGNTENYEARFRLAEAVCREALEAIAPCVVGWEEGVMPVWAEKLSAVVPHLQDVLGIAHSQEGDRG